MFGKLALTLEPTHIPQRTPNPIIVPHSRPGAHRGEGREEAVPGGAVLDDRAQATFGAARSMIAPRSRPDGSVPYAWPQSPPRREAQKASATAGGQCLTSNDPWRTRASRSTTAPA